MRRRVLSARSCNRLNAVCFDGSDQPLSPLGRVKDLSVVDAHLPHNFQPFARPWSCFPVLKRVIFIGWTGVAVRVAILLRRRVDYAAIGEAVLHGRRFDCASIRMSIDMSKSANVAISVGATVYDMIVAACQRRASQGNVATDSFGIDNQVFLGKADSDAAVA